MNVQSEQTVKRPRLKQMIWILAVVAIIAAAAFAIGLSAVQQKNQPPEIVTLSTLQKIVDVSELSTYTAVYNGIATVNDENKPDEVKYYVSTKPGCMRASTSGHWTLKRTKKKRRFGSYCLR